jgi:hypothetical protein
MSTSLNGKTIAFLVATERVEQVELTEPDTADTFEADKTADRVSTSDYAALVLPAVRPTPTSCAPTTPQLRSSRVSSTAASRLR